MSELLGIEVTEAECFMWDLEMMVTWLREQQQGLEACEEYGDAMEHCKLALRNLQNRQRKIS